MTDPASLSAVALATLVVTKALEKSGQILGEKLITQSEKLIQILQKRFPKTVQLIKNSQKTKNKEVFLDPEVVVELETIAKQDPEINALIQNLSETAKRQVMASGIQIKGSLEVGNMRQSSTNQLPADQIMFSDNSIEGDVRLGDLTQEG